MVLDVAKERRRIHTCVDLVAVKGETSLGRVSRPTQGRECLVEHPLAQRFVVHARDVEDSRELLTVDAHRAQVDEVEIKPVRVVAGYIGTPVDDDFVDDAGERGTPDDVPLVTSTVGRRRDEELILVRPSKIVQRRCSHSFSFSGS